MFMGRTDVNLIMLACSYAALRVGHSLIHLTVNKVPPGLFFLPRVTSCADHVGAVGTGAVSTSSRAASFPVTGLKTSWQESNRESPEKEDEKLWPLPK